MFAFLLVYTEMGEMNPHHTAKSSFFGHLVMLAGPGAAGEPKSGDAKTS